MGAIWSDRNVAVSFEMKIDAPADVVWEVFEDIDAMPSIITAIKRIERVKGEEYMVGTRWREIREYDGMPVISNVSITHIAEDLRNDDNLLSLIGGMTKSSEMTLHKGRSVSFASTFDDVSSYSFVGSGTVATSTAVVLALEDELSQIIASFVVVTPTCAAIVYSICCGPIVRRGFSEHFRQEFDEMAAEARRRFLAGEAHKTVAGEQ